MSSSMGLRVAKNQSCFRISFLPLIRCDLERVTLPTHSIYLNVMWDLYKGCFRNTYLYAALQNGTGILTRTYKNNSRIK